VKLNDHQNGTAHTALDDERGQASAVMAVYQALRLVLLDAGGVEQG
jgi:hypothetical protein